MRALNYVATTPWAITEDYLKLIVEISSRETIDLSVLSARKAECYEAKDNTSKVENNVAIIPIKGPIMRYGNFFSDISSGATTVTSIRQKLDTALSDDSIEAIMFDIDSPGGEVNGINELSEYIYSKRGEKKMVSYVGHLGASAAYWIASATDKIVCEETASLGSVGVMATLIDTKKKDEQDGVEKIEFVSSNSPNKSPDPTTEDGKSLIQAQIDSIADIFISKVARNRSKDGEILTHNDVVKRFNEGGILIGKDAVKAGMADEIGSFDSVLMELKGDVESLDYEEETSMEDIMDENLEDTVESSANAEDVTSAVASDSTPLVETEAYKALLREKEEAEKAQSELLARIEAMETNNKKLELANIEHEAEKAYNKFQDKLVPAQKDAFISDYVQRAMDDKENPLSSGSRVEKLNAIYEALPSHSLNKELMEDTDVLESSSKDVVDELEVIRARGKSLAQQLNAKKR